MPASAAAANGECPPARIERSEEAVRLVSSGAASPLDRAVSELKRRAESDIPQAVAAASLLLNVVGTKESPAIDGSVLASLPAADARSSPQTAAAADALYQLAFRADAAGRLDEAVVVLCALAGTGWGEFDGCLGLAVIAARLKLFNEAMVLATRCLGGNEGRHPRALCVVGICELENGDINAAQTYLAAAARIARANPAFREDLQAAQRALLLMHLS